MSKVDDLISPYDPHRPRLRKTNNPQRWVLLLLCLLALAYTLTKFLTRPFL